MKATVVVLTFNAKPWIRDLLTSVEKQKAPWDFEILVIDSGSRDGTLEVVGSFPRVKLHQIPNSEFGHGKTRNLAAKMAKGEFVIFLTHDAVPAHEHWLEEMVRPFELNPEIVGVYGKQIPRPDCCPTVKRDVIDTFARFGPDHYTMVQQANPMITDQASRDAINFFSDVNSAVRRSFHTTKLPYRDINYSEDYAWGKDVIDAGYKKAYAPLGAVIHSHSYAPMKYLRRMYDEMNGLKAATGRTLDTSISYHIVWVVKSTLQDWRFILRDRAYGPRTKMKYLLQAPVYNIFRRMAVRLSNKDRLPTWAHHLLSLEHNLKKRAT